MQDEYARYDQARQQDRYQKAARSIHGSTRDPLLRRGNRVTNTGVKSSRDWEENARAWLLALGVATFTFGFFMIMMLMWFVVYYHSFELLVLVFVGLVLISGILIMVGARHFNEPTVAFRPKALMKNRGWMVWLGLLSLLATVVGAIAGFFIYYNQLVFYNNLQEMRTYTNVGASQTKDMVSDGAIFQFSEDSRLDTLRSVGYQSKWNGGTYCVAPIVDTGMGSGDEINFWAVGEDCCGTRAQFQCDSAQDFSVSSGLRVLHAKDIVRPQMQWAVSINSDPIEQYNEAIRLQEATYYTHSARDPVFIEWVKDPADKKKRYLRNARIALAVTSIIFFILCAALTYVVIFRALVPRKTTRGMPLR